MKFFAAIILVGVLAFAGIKVTQTRPASAAATPKHDVMQEDMTQFSSDLEKFMTTTVEKNGAPANSVVITADCKNNQGAHGTRCWIHITQPMTGVAEKATAEHVRRVGNAFLWDHEA